MELLSSALVPLDFLRLGPASPQTFLLSPCPKKISIQFSISQIQNRVRNFFFKEKEGYF
jgi:hypothetical protein